MTAHAKPNALYLLDLRHLDHVYGPDVQQEIATLVHLVAPPQTREGIAANPGLLADVEVLLGSWGMSVFDEAFLKAAPKLKAVFYGAGSVKALVTDAFWKRGILITNGRAANAVAVSEYTLAAILFSLKHAWFSILESRREEIPRRSGQIPGAFGSTVGLISLGAVGQLVRERLRPFDLRVLAHDPFLNAARAADLDVTPVSLEQLFAESHVVSVHAPSLPSTRGMITGQLLASMKPGATFINTSRGAVVRETELLDVARQRPDLFFVLDVTDPEPPVDGSPIFRLPNMIYTPHIAGSVNNECRRMGQLMLDELKRYLAGQPLKWAVTRQSAEQMA